FSLPLDCNRHPPLRPSGAELAGRIEDPGSYWHTRPRGWRQDATGRARMPKLRPSGGYRHLRSFQVATIVYDATVSFCDRFLDRRSRTVDQMVQAARSGRQNIAEGSRASATSSQTELRLT